MANKDFKVKNGLDIQTPLPVSMGGTGQTSTSNALNSLLPLQTNNSGKYLTTDGTNTSWGTVTVGFIPTPSTSISSNITLNSFNKYFVDTSVARTLTLPASPSLGDEIYIYDASGQAKTNNITIQRNSSNINGVADNAIIDVNQSVSVFIYTGSTVGWRFD